jgi:glycosyltransferase 2 family protein
MTESMASSESLTKQAKAAIRKLRSSKLAGKSGLWTFIVAMGVFLFLGLSLKKDWNTIQNYPWQLHWTLLGMTALLHVLAITTMFFSWYFIILRLANKNNWRLDIKIYSLSLLARRIPLPIWYVGSRVVLYQGEGISSSIVMTATALEIALIALSGIVCYILLLPWYAYTQLNLWQPLAFGAGVFILAMMIRPGLLVDLVNLLLRILKRPPIPSFIHRRDLFVWFFLYLATWFFDGLGLYFTVAAFLPQPPSAISVIGVATITSLVAILTMLLPTGFGLKEITMGALLGAWIPVAAGVLLSLVYRLNHTLIETLLAFIGQKIAGKPAKKGI